jgi:hypothetical protein
MVRITFSEPIENTNDEIAAVVAQIQFDGDTKPFTGTFFDDDGDQLNPPHTFISTNDASLDDLQTFFLQVTTAGQTWNTDATGISAGAAVSTDREGNHMTIIPDIDMLKGVFFDAGGHNMVRNYGENALAAFTATSDQCRPALVNVVAGRADHKDSASDLIYDAHNYFHLKYSEPVIIGDLAGAVKARAGSTFDNAAEHGGDIVDSGSDVTFTGYFKYGNIDVDGDRRLVVGAKDGSPPSTLYRDNTNGENPSAAHGLTIYIAGYRDDDAAAWPGYIGEPGVDDLSFLTESDLDPVGAAVAVLANDYITDTSPALNTVEPSSDLYDDFWPTITDDVTNMGSAGVSMPVGDTNGWDVDPPVFSVYEAGPPSYFEIVSITSLSTGLVNRLEFALRDNFTGQGGWTPKTIVHPFSGADFGVRDSSFGNFFGLTPSDAFTVGDVNAEILVSTYNLALETKVNNILYDPSVNEINVADDSYFTLTITDAGHGWNAISALQINYDSVTGLLTDLAGNIIPSTAIPMAGVERTPPVISLALASVGDNKIYVRFSEPVFGNGSVTPRTAIDKDDFEFTPGTVSITDIEPISYYNDGILEAWFNLSANLTADAAVSERIVPKVNSIYDKITNIMQDSSVHRVTDIGIGVMTPVWAADNIHNAEHYGSDDRTLRVFDGTGYLSDSNITLETSIQAGSYTEYSAVMYYDVDPDDSVLSDSFWLPSFSNALVPDANSEARGLVPFRAEGSVRDFLIPANDEEIVSGNKVQFIVKLGDLFCANLLDSDDPRSLIPWSFSIKDVLKQSAGVTILNNVINTGNGEKTILTYDLSDSGMVVINVFNLAGDLVDVIHRGAQGTGTYTYTWDGTNRAGTTVARGIYFIRVVAPGIDEFRKVMIVK